ncbi:MAG TPA: hypothetical protein VGM50_15690 [Gemmatimonadaceae bacterium]|jgi:hypothetical protein
MPEQQHVPASQAQQHAAQHAIAHAESRVAAKLNAMRVLSNTVAAAEIIIG